MKQCSISRLQGFGLEVTAAVLLRADDVIEFR